MVSDCLIAQEVYNPAIAGERASTPPKAQTPIIAQAHVLRTLLKYVDWREVSQN